MKFWRTGSNSPDFVTYWWFARFLQLLAGPSLLSMPDFIFLIPQIMKMALQGTVWPPQAKGSAVTVCTFGLVLVSSSHRLSRSVLYHLTFLPSKYAVHSLKTFTYLILARCLVVTLF